MIYLGEKGCYKRKSFMQSSNSLGFYAFGESSDISHGIYPMVWHLSNGVASIQGGGIYNCICSAPWGYYPRVQ